jgi:hypothetical protein
MFAGGSAVVIGKSATAWFGTPLMEMLRVVASVDSVYLDATPSLAARASALTEQSWVVMCVSARPSPSVSRTVPDVDPPVPDVDVDVDPPVPELPDSPDPEQAAKRKSPNRALAFIECLR